MTNEPRQSTVGVDGKGPRWGALAYASYRRFWLASLVRVFGLQFRIFGAGWLVVAVLDRSPLWLGVVGLAQALPTIILSVPAGLLADRLDNQRLLVLSQTATTIVHFVLAALVVADMANIWLVIVVGLGRIDRCPARVVAPGRLRAIGARFAESTGLQAERLEQLGPHQLLSGGAGRRLKRGTGNDVAQVRVVRRAARLDRRRQLE